MKNTTFLLIVMLSIVFSCKKENLKEKFRSETIEIKGKIENLKDSTRVVLKRKNSNIKDTTFVFQKTFLFKVKKDTLQPDISYITFLTKGKKSNTIPFWDENINIIIKGDAKNPKTIRVKNNESNNVFNEFWSINSSYNNVLENLFKSKISNKKKSKILKLYMDTIKTKHKDLFFKNPNNTYSMYRIFFNVKNISKDSLLIFYNNLNPKFKNSKNGLLLKEYLSTKKIKIGEPFKNFTARNLEGKIVKLSDFKGRIIVLDFWAKWCKWCHVQNKNEFTPLHKKYKDVIFISYALDEDIKEWETSSKKDSITWVNLSNLKGTKDPVAYQYNVTLLPHTFLIDTKGIIIKEYTGYSGKNIIEEDIKKLLLK